MPFLEVDVTAFENHCRIDRSRRRILDQLFDKYDNIPNHTNRFFLTSVHAFLTRKLYPVSTSKCQLKRQTKIVFTASRKVLNT